MRLPNLPTPRQKLGKTGEDLALSYLQRHGFSIVERNFKIHYGELDIVCFKDNTLVIVEVKTRIGNSYGTPEESVTPRKLKEVIKTAEFFKSQHPELPESMRIDIVGIVLNIDHSVRTINHTVNVTG
jgi:putative endonuclease